MSMSSIRRSFLKAARRQVRTAELGHPILRVILGFTLALDVAAGHPLWLTVGVIAAITAVFLRAAKAIRREAAEPLPGTEGPGSGE